MFKKILMLGVVSFMFFGAGNSFAQFGNFGGVLGSVASKVTGGGGVVVSVTDLGSSRDQAITDYLAATKELDVSLEKAGEAFGVKKEVLEKLAVVQSLKEGNINDNDLDKSRQSSQEAQAIIAQKMKETSAPSMEDKKLLGGEYDPFSSRYSEGYCVNWDDSEVIFSGTVCYEKCFSNGNNEG